jgi:hypothetical protein
MPGRRHGWPQGWRAVLATWVSVVWRSYLLVLPLPLAWWLLTGTLQSNIDLISKYGYAALPPGVLGGWVAIGLAPPIIGVLALVVLRYGVALSVAGLLLLFPAVVLISMFPLLSALIPIGLVARVALRRRSAKAAAELEHPTLNRL